MALAAPQERLEQARKETPASADCRVQLRVRERPGLLALFWDLPDSKEPLAHKEIPATLGLPALKEFKELQEPACKEFKESSGQLVRKEFKESSGQQVLKVSKVFKASLAPLEIPARKAFRVLQESQALKEFKVWWEPPACRD